jgi:hypothetical protein
MVASRTRDTTRPAPVIPPCKKFPRCEGLTIT